MYVHPFFVQAHCCYVLNLPFLHMLFGSTKVAQL
jgi:hypothetical protein